MTGLVPETSPAESPRPKVPFHWSTREVAALRAHYPTEGFEGAAKHLPGRSIPAIYRKAAHLGLKRVGYTPKLGFQRYRSSEHIDRRICDVYPNIKARGGLQKLCEAVNRPRWWVSNRANVLGLGAPRFKEPDWVAAEEQILTSHPYLGCEALRKRLAKAGFKRSEASIASKLRRLGACTADPNHYTGSGLARLMGVSSMAVSKWCRDGWLVAERKGTARVVVEGSPAADTWWIHRRDVRNFIRDHAAHVNVARCDKFWLIDLLCGIYQ